MFNENIVNRVTNESHKGDVILYNLSLIYFEQ